ncbi:MAG: YlmH/Sll1252 family protein, partial [bacterium]
MLDRERLSSHLHNEDDLMLAGHIFDKIEMVMNRKSNESTNFLNPYQTEIATGIIKQIYDVNFIIDGGYKGAERKRITVFPEYLFPDHVDSPVRILKLSGNFKFQPVNHRDFLGAIMGLGIKRDMVGD